MSKSANIFEHIGQEVMEQKQPPEVNMTEEQLNAELEKGYASLQAGQTISVTEAFTDIRREYNKS